jgi:hypothetical protein
LIITGVVAAAVRDVTPDSSVAIKNKQITTLADYTTDDYISLLLVHQQSQSASSTLANYINLLLTHYTKLRSPDDYSYYITRTYNSSRPKQRRKEEGETHLACRLAVDELLQAIAWQAASTASGQLLISRL